MYGYLLTHTVTRTHPTADTGKNEKQPKWNEERKKPSGLQSIAWHDYGFCWLLLVCCLNFHVSYSFVVKRIGRVCTLL